MTSKWTVAALLFSVAVNIAAVGTLIFFRQAERHPAHLRLLRTPLPPPPDFLWLSTGEIDPESLRERFEIRRSYRKQLREIQREIDLRRSAIVTQLQKEPVQRDSLNLLLERLSAEQIRAERLTVEHLLALKPILPEAEWRLIIRELETPPRHIRRLSFEQDSTLKVFLKEQKSKEIKIVRHKN